jgi:hypothetical protein
MNPNPQLDLHPDAESLNAFAEQSLPEQEREQVLLHLGGCGRCRQVVYLAHEAAARLAMDEAEAFRPELDPAAVFGYAAAMAPAPAEAAGSGPVGDRAAVKRARRWFWGWHLAWVPAAALAAIVGVAIFVRVERVQPGFESGNEPLVVAPQSAPRQVAKNDEPLPEAKAAAGNAKPAATPATPKAPAPRTFSAAENAPKEKLSAEPPAPTPPAFQVDRERRPDSEGDGRMAQMDERRQAITAQTNAGLFKPPAPSTASLPPPPAPAPTADARSFQPASASATASRIHGVAGAHRASPGASASAAAPAVEMKSESLGSLEASQQEPSLSTAKSAGARKAKIVVLPSGLRAVSTASARDYALAIDESGALFLSRDVGIHWEPVAHQWSGRAVTVRIQGGFKMSSAAGGAFTAARAEDSSSNSNDSGDARPDASAPPALPAVFEIVNDREEVWTSTDGKSWKAK